MKHSDSAGMMLNSCDLLAALDGSRYRIEGDLLKHLDDGWDMVIAHPPCTYLTRSGLRWITSPPKVLQLGVLYGEARQQAMEQALGFVVAVWNAPVKKLCIENPRGVLSWRWRKPDQAVQPWMFGHGEVKETCFWKRGLPDLRLTNGVGFSRHYSEVVAEREPRVYLESAGIENGLTRAQRREITLPGIAEAMAEQWGGGKPHWFFEGFS